MRFKTPYVDAAEGNSRLKPISVYKLYLVMKNHFAGKYDAIKYRWEIKVTEANFQKRKDRYFFKKLADRFTFKEIYYIFLSNFITNPDFWVGDANETDSISFYRQYLGRVRRIDNIFVDDIKTLHEFAKMKEVSLNTLFEYSKVSSTSYISKLVMSGVITYESFLILDSILDIINKHDESATDFVWGEFSKKLNAYRKIVIFSEDDIKKYKQILKETLINLKR